MDKWAIEPAPSAHDPRRHVLLVRGKVKDLSPILKKFGGPTCGRPSPVKTQEGYNLRMYLHRLSPRELESLTVLLNELAPRPAPVPASVAQTSAASFVETPPPLEAPGAPEQEKSPELIPLSPAAPSAPEPAARPLSAKPLWGLRDKLDARRNFNSVLVGAYNRFAHAAATAVASSPGSIYNPLFLYGPPGVGKTHMLQAVGAEVTRATGEGSVLLTSGARLSRSVNCALAEGRIGEIETAMSQAKVLLVDDIHLLAVTDQSRSSLAKIFSLFLERNLQIVVGSLYPPRALGALEEALKISFDRGWSVDLKVPGPSVQADILHAFCERNALNIDAADLKAFHEKLGGNYFESARWMRRLAVLAKIPSLAAKYPKVEDLVPLLFDMAIRPRPALGGSAGDPDFPSPGEVEEAGRSAPPEPGPQAMSLAILLPKGTEGIMAPWTIARFCQAGAQYAIPQAYRYVRVGAYDAGQPYGAPFQIGETCLASGAQAALIMGPPRESNLAAREGEFSHAVGHILESLEVAMGWIPHRGTMCDGHFLRAHLDFLAPRYD